METPATSLRAWAAGTLLVIAASATPATQQPLRWRDPTIVPWTPRSNALPLVTADPFAFELAALQRDIGQHLMHDLRRLLGTLAVDDATDPELRAVVLAARSDATAPAFRKVLMRTRWRTRPAGCAIPSGRRPEFHEVLEAAELLYGEPTGGGPGWLNRVLEDEGTTDFPECLVPRVPDPLAYRTAEDVPAFLRQPVEEALADPATAMRTVHRLAQHCRASGTITGVRRAAWACVEAMTSPAWSTSAQEYPGLDAVRAESALALVHLIRISELEGLVQGAVGGGQQSPPPTMLVVMSDAECTALDAWCTSIGRVLDRLGGDMAEAPAWQRNTRWTLEYVQTLLAAARTVRASADSGEGLDERAVELAAKRLERANFGYSWRGNPTPEGPLVEEEWWPDEFDGAG